MQNAKQLYLDLLKRCLSNVIYQDRNMLEGRDLPFPSRRASRAATGPRWRTP
jgi:hypothetical protein